MKRRKTVNIIYDGHCAFCIRSLNLVRAVDIYGLTRFYDSHEAKTFERFPELRAAATDEAMYVVVENEPPYQGFFAFRRLMWCSPLTWALLPLFYFPGASFFGTRIYRWVARNRSRFGCGSGVCSLPTHPRARRISHEG